MGGVSDIAALSRLLDAALALPSAQRPRWLDALRGGDRAFEPVLRRLLAEHEHPQRADFLHGLPRLAPSAEDPRPDPGLRADDAIGPYRLLRELGRGGMGAVWLAERADGAYSRRVALKVPRLERDLSLGQRLALERDIAAPLEHPNIARLYDAGADAQGRPYLALQYIEGVPIDRFCREHALPAPARLRLFLQVVRAVSYAHGRLVVHRDIKPSNILVSSDGQAHLLDFGIAGLLHDAAGTALHAPGLTPSYAAPEQIAGAPVTVSCDVYSLGVLLHELLTGMRPPRPARTPSPPQAPVRMMADAAAGARRAQGEAASPRLPRDLQAILAKALRHDPAARYPSADALADDVQRYLSCEPVRARASTVLYRVHRTVQRHRLAFGALAIAALAIVASVAVAWSQARQATAAAARARVVTDFVVDVFRVNARDNPATAELRQLPAELLLERGARLIETRFRDQPDLQAELYGLVAGIFLDMASPKLAVDYAERQVQALSALRAPPAAQAAAALSLARALLSDDQLAKAELQARRALQLAGGEAESENELAYRARLLLADTLLHAARDAQAGAVLDRVRADLARHPRVSGSLRAEAARLQANRLNYLHNRFDEAKPLYEAAIRDAVAAQGATSPRAVAIRGDLVFSLINRHRAAEARPHLQAALDALRATGGQQDIPAALFEAMSVKWMYVTGQLDYRSAKAALLRDGAALAAHGAAVPETVRARLAFQLGSVESEWGRSEESYRLLADALAVLRPRVETPWSRYTFLATVAAAAMDVGRHEEAAALFDEALQVGRRVVPASSPWLADTYSAAAINLSMLGRHDQAERLLAGLPRIDDVPGESRAPARYRDMVAVARARVALLRGDARAALARLPEGTDATADDRLLDRRLVQGAALCALRQPAQGLALLQAGVANAARDHDPSQPAVAYWRSLAGLCALDAGEREAAAALAAQARRAFDDQPGVSAFYKAPWLRLEQRLRPRAGRGHAA